MVIQIKSNEDIAATYQVMRTLRQDFTDIQSYLIFVKRLMETYGYHLVAFKVNGEVEAVAGYRFGESLAWKKYLYIDDIVTNPHARSRGYGKKLLKWLIEEAKKNDCKAIHLDSGVQRHEAHRFYLRERMDIVFYHFRLDL